MQINLLSFATAVEDTELDVYTDKAAEQYPQSLFKDECPELWEQHSELAEKERLFFSVANAATECKGEKYTIQINLSKQIRIAKHLINGSIYNHFKNIAAVGFDFVDNVEVWIKDPDQQPDPKTTQYRKFSLAPQYRTITDGWELLVSFNGCSLVYNKSIDTLNIQALRYKVIAGGEVIKYKHLSPQHKQNITSIFPIINRENSAEFDVSEKRTKTDNKYTQTYKYITDFAKQYLFTADFQKIINFSCTDFVTVSDSNLFQVATGANSLLFGNNQKGFMQYNGITNNGPYQPTAKNNVHFFFIYNQNDLNVCQRLHDIFSNGMGKYIDNQTGEIKYKFPPLAQYIKQPFNTDPNGSISFSNTDNALTEIATKLNAKPLVNGYNYVAIYISPINKDDINNPQHDIYYQLKELLLEKGITSQVIYKENPTKYNFNFFLPNIAIALLAKIGGIPWQLQPNNGSRDLIVGVGAFKSEKIGKRYIGSAFCFNRNGVFQNFDCYRDNNLEKLVSDIRKALGHFLVDSDNPKRIIIHYYKTMGKKESKPITDMLYQLGFRIPVFIVTINKTETHDIVAFDTDFSDLMPISGTIVKVKHNQFLLYNNARYANSSKFDYLFPVKVKISKVVKGGSPEDNQATMPEVAEMLNQVYQFSRMYWKSVKQQNLPVTIKYPEMVAEIVPHFSDAELPAFGKTNLWFL